jgi:hypothetical protein
LGTLIDKLTTMVADLQKIDAEQQECLYKLEVMAGIRSTVMEPPLLPTPTAATGTSVPPPLPYTPSPQPVVWLEPPPPEAVGVIEDGDGKATSCGPEPRPALPPASLTAGAVPSCGLEHPPVPPLSASTGTAAACRTAAAIAICGHKVQPVSSPSTPTTSATTLCGPNTELVSLTSAPTAAARCGPDCIRNDATGVQFIGSEHEPLFPAQLGSSSPARLCLAQQPWSCAIENLPPPSCALSPSRLFHQH